MQCSAGIVFSIQIYASRYVPHRIPFHYPMLTLNCVPVVGGLFFVALVGQPAIKKNKNTINYKARLLA